MPGVHLTLAPEGSCLVFLCVADNGGDISLLDLFQQGVYTGME